MATFTVIGVAIGSRLEGGIRVVETVEGIGITQPHEVNFSATVDKVPGWKAALQAAMQAEADELESVFDL